MELIHIPYDHLNFGGWVWFLVSTLAAGDRTAWVNFFSDRANHALAKWLIGRWRSILECTRLPVVAGAYFR
jgi:hypothetical protein